MGSIPDWPNEKLRILFIHHSCGELLWNTYGNLSMKLADINIEPHDATYGDTIGEDTDVCHWYPKFRDHLNEILTFNHSVDVYYPPGSRAVNHIIMFKSCFPASGIEGWGEEPGDPESCERTIANYKAAYNALLPIFRAHPETLFIPVTAPPLNRYGGWTPENGRNASYFNHWLVEEWAPNDPNIAVFDWFHFLANETDFAAKDYYVEGTDSHPNRCACEETVPVFLDWIDDVILRWKNWASTGTGTYTTGGLPPLLILAAPLIGVGIAAGIIIAAVYLYDRYHK